MEWRPFYYNDSSLGGAGDTIGPIGDQLLHVSNIHIKFTASDTVGNRVPVVLVVDSDGDVAAETRAGVVTAASAARFYNFGISSPDITTVRDTDYIANPLFDMWIPKSYSLVVKDEAGVDPGSDAMELYIFGEITGYQF